MDSEQGIGPNTALYRTAIPLRFILLVLLLSVFAWAMNVYLRNGDRRPFCGRRGSES